MDDKTIILVAEDDEGHYSLISKNLERAGINNEIVHFVEGGSVLDYLHAQKASSNGDSERTFVLLLDIRMPKVDGIEVLRQMKQDDALKRIPVIMLTTTDNPGEVDRCHKLGCSLYIVKPVEYEGFMDMIRKVGQFMSVVRIPTLN